MCPDTKQWQEMILAKAQQQYTLSFPDEKAEPTLFKHYLHYGVEAIKDRRKLTNDNEFLSGKHDYNLVRFIVRSYNEGGIEGVSSATSLGTSRTFSLSPIAELKQHTIQVI